MTQAFTGKTLWIIGASSGIGEALARRLAAEGAKLVLSARREATLQRLAGQLPGEHRVLPLDVADADAVAQAMREVAALPSGIDAIWFLAALYQPMDCGRMDLAQLRPMLEVNLLGAFHLVEAALPVLRRQGRGQLALCGSVAAYGGLRHGQPYSATKAAIRNLAESLRCETADQPDIDIRLISPGFVRTPLTDKNDFPMPCILEPEAAAEHIVKGLGGRAFEVHFPKKITIVMKLLAFLPYPIYFWLIRKFL